MLLSAILESSLILFVAFVEIPSADGPTAIKNIVKPTGLNHLKHGPICNFVPKAVDTYSAALELYTLEGIEVGDMLSAIKQAKTARMTGAIFAAYDACAADRVGLRRRINGILKGVGKSGLTTEPSQADFIPIVWQKADRAKSFGA